MSYDFTGLWEKNKRWLGPVLLGVLLFALGFGTAIFARPTKVVTKTEVKTEVKTVVQYQDRIVTQKVFVEVEKKDTHTDVTVIKRPDGTTVTHTTTDTHVDEHENQNTNTDATHNQTSTQVATQTVYKEKLVLNQPNWDLGVGVGVSIPVILGKPQLGVPGLQYYVLQADAKRRILGPLWLGVWGNTQGTAGLSLSGSF